MSDPIDFDVLVIGAGAIGLATATACASSGKKTLLVEAGSTFADQTSSRNSEVIHSGIYYELGSMKEQFCLKGKELLYDYLCSREIPKENCGKLLFCNDIFGEKN